MIPHFNHAHVLPPFVGERLSAAASSPYLVSASELIQRFCSSPPRAVLLRGLLAYRERIGALGFIDGFQWINGSFTENVEAQAGRPPNDVDLVTFARPPLGLSHTQINALMQANLDVFDRDQCRSTFHCDSFLVSLTRSPERLVQDVRYWYGLFSHRKADHVWKGLLQIPLTSDDDVGAQLLNNAFAHMDDDARSA
ncbi:MAG: hypothetical protein JWP52_2040 [Rhizobacter sp.]|nr:hypothetical protein [Rhizobacter sp.]